jgi:hypothetical protein
MICTVPDEVPLFNRSKKTFDGSPFALQAAAQYRYENEDYAEFPLHDCFSARTPQQALALNSVIIGTRDRDCLSRGSFHQMSQHPPRPLLLLHPPHPHPDLDPS